MITLHRLNGDAFVLNAELIETVEATPDTLVTLVDRRRLMVAESVDDVVDRFLGYRRTIAGVPFGAVSASTLAAD